MRSFILYTLLLLMPAFGFCQNGYDFYISNFGNDNNSGTSVSKPRKTLSGSIDLFNAAATRKGNVSIALGAGSTFTETFSPAYSVNFGTYSNNSSDLGFAILNGSDVYDKGWIKNASSKNTFSQEIKISGFTGNGINTIGQYSYVYVIEIDKQLEKTSPITARKLLQFVAGKDSVDEIPGSFYEAPVGAKDPIIVLIHTSNGLSPNSNPKYRYEVSVRGKAIDATLYTGKFENLWIRGFGAGYGGVPAGANSYFNKVIFGPGAAIHHAVIKSGVVTNSLFLPTSGNVDGGALVFYDVEGAKRHNVISNTIFMDIPSPIYMHDSYGVNYGGLEINNVFAFGNTFSGATFVGLENTDSITMNNIYTDKLSSVYRNGSPAYVSIRNSCFRQTSVGMTFKDNPVNVAIDNVLFTVIGPRDGFWVRSGAATNLQLTHSIIHFINSGEFNPGKRDGSFIEGNARPDNHITATGNIFICNVNPAKYVDMVSTSIANGIGTSTDRWNNNVYILVSGMGMNWYAANSSVGTLPIANFKDWQKQSGQDKNSLYFDLRNDPRGLKAIFIDPDNGDYELANTPEADKIRALRAGMTTPTTCFLARPSYEAAAQMIRQGKLFSSTSCTNPCLLKAIRGGNFLYADIANNTDVELQWNNTSQANIDHYEIERAAFGTTDFVKVASVPVASSEAYTYTDKTLPAAGIYTYRLTVVASSGNTCSSYDYTITVSNVSQNGAVRVYPNPAHDVINVYLQNLKDITSISVVNNLGEKIKIQKAVAGISNAQFDLKDQHPGPYWIKIESSHGSYIEPFILL